MLKTEFLRAEDHTQIVVSVLFHSGLHPNLKQEEKERFVVSLSQISAIQILKLIPQGGFRNG